jgi:hypothetical protein
LIIDTHAHFVPPIGDWEPMKVVDAPALGAAERAAIAGDTAAGLFNIKPAA